MEICESIILTYFFWKYIGNMEHISIIFPSYFQWKYEAVHPVIYILRTISTTILGIAVKNNNDDSARNKKYYCRNKEVSL